MTEMKEILKLENRGKKIGDFLVLPDCDCSSISPPPSPSSSTTSSTS
eukprot:CAMPEP_0114392482 /NCGR_PEP_ID=MMETSP0102-20121206/10838_1 /TAXON_ID=38822 ORGANISM="Pteridomonas danica, Strain PT" /NCGR_SAMPLE_ID=MMETSP0102 /ASSEMBLY_ACC=CAM_ASM_000212 /LENGTH=46 /DNA_ID= /DNA_START= /DNA_END= /DNA_ORIENTATION=